MPTAFDLLIRNGTILDGTGRPAFSADLGVVGDTITEIGIIPPEAQAAQTLDATGLVVAPGFIDIHTHADIALLARPQHLPKIMQGVTTEVFTNCGLGFAPVTEAGLAIQRRYIAGLFGDDGNAPNPPIPLGAASNATTSFTREGGDSALDSSSPAARERGSGGEGHWAGGLGSKPRVDWNWRTVAEFLSRYEAAGIGANVIYLIPHGSVRVSAMGMEERPADAEELRRMLALVEQGMEEGAWGLSTGIWYAPMRAADRTELVALCRAAGFFATHQRDYGDHIFAATSESLEIAREAGVPVQIAHLQMNGPDNAGRAGELLALLERARAQGIDITCDTYPYTAGSTFLQSLLPAWATDGGPEKILQRLAESETRARIVEAIGVPPSAWERFQLVGATSKANAGFEGQTFDVIAAARKLTVPEWVCAALEEEELRACYVQHAAHEGNVREILRWPHQMVGSDGLHLPGKTHPRLYGTFPRVLGRYVREEKNLSLEEAIHKMTGMPAARLRLNKRGLLREGYAADLVVIDPATVCDTATFEDPLRYPTGIPYVFVNGVAVKAGDIPTDALAGKVLRRV